MSGYKNDLNPQQVEALKAFQDRLDADITPLKEENKSVSLKRKKRKRKVYYLFIYY